ncbi:MAG: leucyl aminopeptidase [Gammaproteobacteria bacterium]|jgi:leucyl aminopeptidase|nr:leucyl aminopeptidase [Gammaproteobacteria bacterium]
MKYQTKTGSLTELSTPCLITGMSNARKVAAKHGQAALFDAATGDFTDKPGNTQLVTLTKESPVKRLLVAGGADAEVSAAEFRKIADAVARAVRPLKAASAIWALTGVQVTDRDLYFRVSNGLAALANALYQFKEYKTGDNGPGLTLRTVAVHADARTRATVQRAVREAGALHSGLNFARDLGNQPPNVCNPTYLLREARKLAKLDKVKVSALDEKRMTELGMGAFMSVSQGSDTPGKMIIVEYKGGKTSDAPVVLVGKGITFDTGGISLKPGANMDEMKFDMCGAATVLGAARAAAEAKLPLNLITVVAAAENMPDGKASRPGDIVTTMSGKTVEILNTDAEGRLVLCDALTYVERYKPKAVVDVATLTGAMIMALGSYASGLFTKDDALADALLGAGDWSGDKAWRMPLWDEYQDMLKSNFADIPNIGSPGAGAITAACFLSRFTDKYSWAHLDIAGSGFQGGAAKGATGRPVGLLFRYLVQASE